MIAAVRKKDLLLPRWTVHCLHVRFTPRVQGRIALDRRAILLSSRNLHAVTMSPIFYLYPEDKPDRFHLLLIREIHCLIVLEAK